MVWSQPDGPEPQSKYHNGIPSRNSSRRRPRRSSTSTIFTTTTGYSYTEDEDNDTTSYSEARQASIPLAYTPSEATSANRTYTQISQSHISPTPHSSQDYQSQDLLIPSAQPTTPIFPPPSGPAFSTSGEPSPLPSPPESLPSAPSSPAHSRRTSSFGSSSRRRSSTPAPPGRFEHSQTQPQPYQTPHIHTNPRGGRGRGRGRPRGRGRGNSRSRTNRPSLSQQSSQSTEDGGDAMDMATLLDGIGRMHIAMNQDSAGRWRIKRHEGDHD